MKKIKLFALLFLFSNLLFSQNPKDPNSNSLKEKFVEKIYSDSLNLDMLLKVNLKSSNGEELRAMIPKRSLELYYEKFIGIAKDSIQKSIRDALKENKEYPLEDTLKIYPFFGDRVKVKNDLYKQLSEKSLKEILPYYFLGNNLKPQYWSIAITIACYLYDNNIMMQGWDLQIPNVDFNDKNKVMFN